MQAARFVAGSGRGGTLIGLKLRRLSIKLGEIYSNTIPYHVHAGIVESMIAYVGLKIYIMSTWNE